MPFCMKVFVNLQYAKTSDAKNDNEEYCIHEYTLKATSSR